jgi:siroheme synthase
MTETPGDRIRKLLLRADNTLAGVGNEAARVVRARRTLEEARDIARDPDVPAPVRDLVQRRLDGLNAAKGSADDPAAA